MARTDCGVSIVFFPQHIAAKWLSLPRFRHLLPNAGQVSLLMKLCFRPQFPHSFDDALSPYGTFLVPLKGVCGFPRRVMAFTGGPVASPTIFIWTNMLSEARQISSVFASVKCDSRRSRSLTLLSRMPKIKRSRYP